MSTLPSSRSRQSGYSLVEMLVVLAIIGIVSLVSVPQFIRYQKSGQLKGSMRQVTNDLRLARQRAVTEHTATRLRFVNNSRSYAVERLDGTTWEPIVTRSIGEGCTLATPSGLTSVVIDGTTYHTVEFNMNGIARVTGANGRGTFRVRTDFALARTSYTVEVWVPGFVKAV